MKKTHILITAAAIIAGLLAGGLPLRAQQHELDCFISDPDVDGMTNIRAAPGGKVLFRVNGSGAYQLTVIVQPGGWWRIKDPENSFGGDVKIPSGGAWIHRSVLALGTDNGDAHHRFLRTEPRPDAPKAGIIRAFNALLRPLEMSPDGEWVKVTYEPDQLTGWIEVSWTRDEDIESGDGFGFPWMYVYATPDRDVPLLTAPDNGEKTAVLEKGKDYRIWVANPRDGWWDVLGDDLDCGTGVILLDEPSWVPGSALRMRIIDPDKQDTVPVYSRADDSSPLAGRLKTGTEVHPLDITADRHFWSEEPIMVRVAPADGSGPAGWVNYTCLSSAPAPSLRYDDVAGTYDGFDERIILQKDGTLRWSVIGKDSYVEFSYILRGNGIYLDVEEADASARPDYIYDPEKKTLSIFDSVYKLQTSK